LAFTVEPPHGEQAPVRRERDRAREPLAWEPLDQPPASGFPDLGAAVDRGCDPGREEHCLRAAARDHAEDDAEDVHQTVLATEDHVAQPVRPAMALAVA
jgi:hypothetical protein